MNVFDRTRAVMAGLGVLTQLVSRHERLEQEAAPQAQQQAEVAGEFHLGAALKPVTDDLRQAAVLYGIAGLALLTHAARASSGDDSVEAQLRWGAFQKSRFQEGEGWRTVTYAFVQRSWAQALLDSVAISALGTMLTRFQSFSVAFSAIRLGVFAPILAAAPKAKSDDVLVSMSGSPYCLMGALLGSALLQRGRLRVDSARDTWALAGVGGLAANMALRWLKADGTARKGTTAAFVAGLGIALIMQAVQTINGDQER